MSILQKFQTPEHPRVIGKGKKQHLGNLDIAFVIPCYDEGYGVLDTIHSIATQKSLIKTKQGVFIVVNNGKNASESIKASNKQTASLLVDMNRGKLEGYTQKMQKKIQKILDAGIPVFLVDAYSQKEAPEICNVGYARDIGSRAALDFLKSDEHFIAQTDADCILLPKYLLGLEIMLLAGESKIATGERDFWYYGKKEEVAKRTDRQDRIANFEKNIRIFAPSYLLSAVSYPKSLIHFTPGSHLIFSKGLYNEIGGFQHIAGAEDVHFGTQARKLGYEVRYLSSTIRTQARVSTRTESGHGFGNEIERIHSRENILETPTKSLEQLELESLLGNILVSAHCLFHADQQKWENFVYQSFCLHTDDICVEDIEELAEIYFASVGKKTSPDDRDLEKHIPFLFSHLAVIIAQYHKKSTLGEVLTQSNDILNEMFFSSQAFQEILHTLEVAGIKTQKVQESFSRESSVEDKLGLFRYIQSVNRFSSQYAQYLQKKNIEENPLGRLMYAVITCKILSVFSRSAFFENETHEDMLDMLLFIQDFHTILCEEKTSYDEMISLIGNSLEDDIPLLRHFRSFHVEDMFGDLGFSSTHTPLENGKVRISFVKN